MARVFEYDAIVAGPATTRYRFPGGGENSSSSILCGYNKTHNRFEFFVISPAGQVVVLPCTFRRVEELQLFQELLTRTYEKAKAANLLPPEVAADGDGREPRQITINSNP